MKIQGGALFYVVSITLVISVTCSLFLYSALLAKQSFMFLLKDKRLIENIDNGINLISCLPETVELGDEKIIDLFGQTQDSVLIKRSSWGIFEKYSVTAFSMGDSLSKTFLVGNEYTDLSALFLLDQGRPLKLAGNTKITGNCFLPRAGVERAYIEGQNFSGDKLINGIVKSSTNKFADLNQELVLTLQDQLQGNFNESFIDVELTDSLENKSLDETFLIKAVNPITLSGYYSGNITFHSKQRIIVKKQAQINGVILIAPEIIFEQDFSGSVQAFASDSIHVGEKCTLSFPSVLGLIPRKENLRPGNLIIGEDCNFSGTIFCYETNFDPKKRALVTIEPRSELIGEIISSSALDLKGKIWGEVICEKFLLRTSSSIYENHLLNAEINSVNVPKGMLFSRLRIKDNKKINVARYL